MDQERLQNASEKLRAASETADGGIQRTLYEQSNSIAELAARSQQIHERQLTEQLDDLQTLIEAIEEADDTPKDVNEHLHQAKSDLTAAHGESDSSAH